MIPGFGTHKAAGYMHSNALVASRDMTYVSMFSVVRESG